MQSNQSASTDQSQAMIATATSVCPALNTFGPFHLGQAAAIGAWPQSPGVKMSRLRPKIAAVVNDK
jgi:hypothetical protein